MPSEDTKILEFNQYQESDKAPFAIYADFECLIEKIDRCKNNPENSCTKQAGENFPSVFSISKISSFKSTENKYDLHGGKDCMKKFCESLREHTMEIIDFNNKKNGVIKKRTGKIISKYKNLLCL